MIGADIHFLRTLMTNQSTPHSPIYDMDKTMRNLMSMELGEQKQWLAWFNVIGNIHNAPVRADLVAQLDHHFFQHHYPALLGGYSHSGLIEDVSRHTQWEHATIGETEYQDIYEKRYYVHNAHLAAAPIPHHERSWWIVQLDKRTANSEDTQEDTIYLLKKLVDDGYVGAQTPITTAWAGPLSMDHVSLAFGWPDAIMKKLWGEQPSISDPVMTGLTLAAYMMNIQSKPQDCVNGIWEAWRNTADPTIVTDLPPAWNARWNASSMSLGACMCAIAGVAECPNDLQHMRSLLDRNFDSLIEKLARQPKEHIERDVLAALPIFIKDTQYSASHVTRRFLKTLLPLCSDGVKQHVISSVCQSVKHNTTHPLWDVLSSCKELRRCLTEPAQVNEVLEAMMVMHPMLKTSSQGQMINQETFQRFWNKDNLPAKNFAWFECQDQVVEHFKPILQLWGEAQKTGRMTYNLTPVQSKIVLTLSTFDPKGWGTDARRVRVSKM